MASAWDAFSQEEAEETWQWERRYAARAQGLKRHKMLAESNVSGVLGKAFGADAHGKAVILTPCHSVMHAVHSLYQFIIKRKKPGPHA